MQFFHILAAGVLIVSVTSSRLRLGDNHSQSSSEEGGPDSDDFGLFDLDLLCILFNARQKSLYDTHSTSIRPGAARMVPTRPVRGDFGDDDTSIDG